jgi:hypothetical protein
MCGCAMMPTSPLIVSIAMTHGPTPDGVDSEKRKGGNDAFIPASPPTALQPSGINMNDKTMISSPCTRSVRADDTSPPTKL